MTAMCFSQPSQTPFTAEKEKIILIPALATSKKTNIEKIPSEYSTNMTSEHYSQMYNPGRRSHADNTL